jgi:hypothetical protein
MQIEWFCEIIWVFLRVNQNTMRTLCILWVCLFFSQRASSQTSTLDMFNYSIGDEFYYSNSTKPSPWSTSTTHRKYSIESKQICEGCYVYQIRGIIQFYSKHQDFPGASITSGRFDETIFYCPANAEAWRVKNANELIGYRIDGEQHGNIPSDAALLIGDTTTIAATPSAVEIDNRILYESDTLGTLIANTFSPGLYLERAELVPTCTTHSDNEYFAIIGRSIRVASKLDFQKQQRYTITLKAYNAYEKTSSTSFELQLRPGKRPIPSGLKLANTSLLESRPLGTLVGKIQVMDGANVTDENCKLYTRYDTINQAGQTKSLDFYISGDSLYTNRAFDFESSPTVLVKLTAVCEIGSVTPIIFDKTLTVDLANDKDCAAEIVRTATDPIMFTTKDEGEKFLWQNSDITTISVERMLKHEGFKWDYSNLSKVRVNVTYSNGCAATSEWYCGMSMPLIRNFINNKLTIMGSVYGAKYHWYKNGQLIKEGAQVADQEMEMNGPGKYQLQVSTDGCFSAMSEPFDPSLVCDEPEITFQHTPWHNFLSVSQGNSFVWSGPFGPDLIYTYQTWFKTVSISQPGKYTVQTKCANGIFNSELEVTPCMLGINTTSITFDGVTLAATEGIGYKWFLNGTLLPDATQTIPLASGGSYQVEVSYGKDCYLMSEPVVITGIPETPNTKLFLVHDGHSIVLKNLDFNDGHIIETILFDSYGRLLHDESEDTQGQERRYDIRGLSNGMYILQVVTSKGIHRFKFLK